MGMGAIDKGSEGKLGSIRCFYGDETSAKGDSNILQLEHLIESTEMDPPLSSAASSCFINLFSPHFTLMLIHQTKPRAFPTKPFVQNLKLTVKPSFSRTSTKLRSDVNIRLFFLWFLFHFHHHHRTITECTLDRSLAT